MSIDQLTYTGYLVIRTCWCGVRHALPEELNREFMARNVDTLYCPLGHKYVPLGRTVPQQLADEKARRLAVQDQLDAAERSARALRGHLTRLRNRIGRGVCPWCQRSFQQVARHVRTQHPERIERMQEALGG